MKFCFLASNYEELCYTLDPKEVYNEDFPGEIFCALKLATIYFDLRVIGLIYIGLLNKLNIKSYIAKQADQSILARAFRQEFR